MARVKREILSAHHLRMDEVWDPNTDEFQEWLRINVEILGEVLKMDLEAITPDPQEGPVPHVCASDVNSDRKVVLQAQHGPSSEDAIGEMLTTGAQQEAAVMILVAESIEPEHRATLDWLNRITDDTREFYAVDLEVLGFGQGQASPLFRPILTPPGWERWARKVLDPQKEQLGPYARFWRGVIDELARKRFLWERAAWNRHSLSVSTGYPAIQYYTAFDPQSGMLHLGIHIHFTEYEISREAFANLQEHRKSMESDLQGFDVHDQLEWNEYEELGAFWVGIRRQAQPPQEGAEDKDLQRWVAERLVKFKYVFDRYLQEVFQKIAVPEETIRARI